MAKGINGRDIAILVNTGSVASPVWTYLAGQMSFKNDRAAAFLDMSSKEDEHTDGAIGRRTSTISVDGLYVPGSGAYARLVQAWENGEEIKLRRREFGNNVKECRAGITSLPEDFPDNAPAKITAAFQVFGKWEPLAIV